MPSLFGRRHPPVTPLPGRDSGPGRASPVSRETILRIVERARGFVSIRRGHVRLARAVSERSGDACRADASGWGWTPASGLTDDERRMIDALGQCTLRFAEASIDRLGMRCLEVVIAGPCEAIGAIEARCDDPRADRLLHDAIERATGRTASRSQLSRIRLVPRG